jgi:uncharacterized membrane protein YgaE (UPF0421/DUF939 family)
MARKANYDVKIEALQAKIEKKQNEIKALKEELMIAKTKKSQGSYKELIAYMEEKNMSAEDVLAMIQ